MQSNTMSNARRLYDVLRKEILTGNFPVDSKLPSVRTLAEQHGLCTNTVSTAIAMLVNEGIATVRKGSGTYVARTPRKSRMIGVMMFDFTHSSRVDSAILEAVQANLPSDYYLTLVNTINDFSAFCDSLENLIDANPAGLLVIPPVTPPSDPATLSRVQELLKSVPGVFINRSIAGVDADIFSMDLNRGMEQALDYLYATGKRKTAVILHNSDKFMHEQLAACNAHIKKHGANTVKIITIPMEGTIQQLREQLESLLGQYDSLITSDNIMEQMTDIFQSKGISIPSQMSLIGINDTLLSRIHNPPLTSIAFPGKQIGKNAIHCLIERIEGRKTDTGKLHNYKPEFIIRKT